jgi:hypothetical protein
VLYASYNDVRLEKARVDALVQQTDQAMTQLTGAPTSINTTTGETVNQLSVLVPSWEETGNDSIEQLSEDWNAFLSSWNGFMSTGVDQTSTLWFPNFPDGGEWAACMQYEAGLAALQTRLNNMGSGGQVPVITPTQSANGGPTPTNLFPWFTPELATTLTNGVYLFGGAWLIWTFGPIVSGSSSLVGSELSRGAKRVRRSNPLRGGSGARARRSRRRRR